MVVKARTWILLVLLGASLAAATTLLALDVPALTKGSALVVRATVRSVEARWTKDGGRIMTDAVLDVTETWKGAPTKQVTVMQPGGIVGEVVHIKEAIDDGKPSKGMDDLVTVRTGDVKIVVERRAIARVASAGSVAAA